MGWLNDIKKAFKEGMEETQRKTERSIANDIKINRNDVHQTDGKKQESEAVKK
jgi:hypothetical protein